MKIILLGAPGAGKGTQAEILSKKLGIPIIGTGNIIREAIKSGSPLGEEFASYTQSGRLVPDGLVVELVAERLRQPDCRDSYIFDGFPRTMAQAERFEQMGGEVDAVIHLVLSDEEVTERMTGRRICSECGRSYHIVANPPAAAGVCDRCGGALVTRPDDTPETVADRLRVYREQTEPLVEFYGVRGMLTAIDATQGMHNVAGRILAVVGEH
jgi:adenylate kinase